LQYGVHPFVVRLRNDQGEPEEGVRITDCGAKVRMHRRHGRG
jgi:hypothetical protein